MSLYMAEAPLPGNAVVAQSGGPTAVINASACGVIEAVLEHSAFEGLLGANHGILGIVQEDLFDLKAEMPATIAGLRQTPAAAIGSCRYKLGDLAADRDKYQRILDVFRTHEVHYFFYIGGNDSMDTADKIHRLAAEQGYPLRVVGVPKTVDNDLVATDHCPGYGSVAKYLATAVMEAGRDAEAMSTFDAVTILEAMGRNSGWIAAATGLARHRREEAPHLIYVPEIPFAIERFLADVQEVHRQLGWVFVVVSEGLVDDRGEYVNAAGGRFALDSFGHRQLGGVADFLQRLVEQELGVKCRYNKPGTCQRNALHCASQTDSEEAYRCGREAVRQALTGASGIMVNLVRHSDSPYRCGTGHVPLAEVANGVKRLPRDFLDVAGTQVSATFRSYASPLVLGEVPVRRGSDGLPEFVRFQRRPIPKKLPAFVGKARS
jgi:6-phosphofructokinase 1